MVAPKSERMVLRHFVPTFYLRLIQTKSVLFLAKINILLYRRRINGNI